MYLEIETIYEFSIGLIIEYRADAIIALVCAALVEATLLPLKWMPRDL
jgi:hypothetical protein